MKKPGLIKRFFSFLLKVIVVIGIMAVIAVGSFEGVTYYLTGSLYDLREAFQQTEQMVSKESKQQEAETKIDDKNMKNTLFFVESSDGMEHYITLHMMNEKSGAVDLLLVPLHAQVTVGKSMQKTLKEKMPEISGNVSLDDVYRVYGEDSYEMISRIVEHIMGIQIAGYDVVSQKAFENILDLAPQVSYSLDHPMSYRTAKGILQYMEEGEQNLDGKAAMVLMTHEDGTDKQESNRLESANTYLESWIAGALKSGKGSKIVASVEKNATSSSGRSFEEEKKIWKSLSGDAVTIRILQGAEKDGVFVIDSQKARLQLATLVKQSNSYNNADKDKDTVYSDSEDDTSMAASSKDYSIELYNAAYISGLAGRWESYLEEEGYQISLIDNYQDEGPISQTRIIVSREGIGQDLLAYFPNAEISVGDIDTGGDIQVYIGTDSTSVSGTTQDSDTAGESETTEEETGDSGDSEAAGNDGESNSYSFDTDSE